MGPPDREPTSGAAPPDGAVSDLDSVPDRSSVTVLVGLPGTGKSTVAPLVAAGLGINSLDLDEEIERRAGRSIPELFDSEGEGGFRARELLALQEALRTGPVVIAAGGGVVTIPEAVAALEQCTVVWLRARPVTLADRISTGADPGSARPLLASESRHALIERLEELSRRRGRSYEELADLVVDVDDRPADRVARELLDALGAHPT